MPGLGESKALSFWNKKATALGDRAIGPRHKSSAQIALRYRVRLKWLEEQLRDLRLRSTLDYGCGIGACSELWMGLYLGVDIVEKLIERAGELHPDLSFLTLRNPWLGTDIDLKGYDVFFTATVLQHCKDRLVQKIFESVREEMPSLVYIVLYENTQHRGLFLQPRTSTDYTKMIEEVGFRIGNTTTAAHSYKGTKHTLTVVEI